MFVVEVVMVVQLVVVVVVKMVMIVVVTLIMLMVVFMSRLRSSCWDAVNTLDR